MYIDCQVTNHAQNIEFHEADGSDHWVDSYSLAESDQVTNELEKTDENSFWFLYFSR